MATPARVSTTGQTLDAQRDQLAAVPCDHIFEETISGARADRPELRKALAALDANDVLMVTRLDRLARSTRDLLDIVHAIDGRGARLKSIADPWADTTTPSGKLILTVLGGRAEFECILIRDRTAEGRARAKSAGQHLGRPLSSRRISVSKFCGCAAKGRTTPLSPVSSTFHARPYLGFPDPS